MKKIIYQLLFFILLVNSSWAKMSEQTAATYKDIQSTLGSVPSFLKAFPEQSISGAWADMKGIQLNPMTAIPGKYKELIGIAVAAQIPCHYCVYFHTQAAKLNKATDQEIKEAIAIAANARRWLTVIVGNDIGPGEFRSDVDKMMTFYVNNQIRQAEEERNAKPVAIDTPEEVYKDFKRIFGFVPRFIQLYPKSGIVGAWEEMKLLDMGPETAIPPKYKDLIGLAVAAQTPNPHLNYLYLKTAMTDEATREEISEAVAMAGITRHWSTILNGSNQSESAFRAEADKVMNFFRKNMVKKVTSR